MSNWDPCAPGVEEILLRAEVRDCRLLPTGSNYVFLVSLSDPDAGSGLGVYKPMKGEAPLWDFPDGTLYCRERASYLLATDLAWGFIPPTVVREGPHGVGTIQLYIPNDARENFFTLRDTHEPELRRMALFDAIANNADRKGGHCLLGPDNRVWGIDHGLTFHVSNKLRTVIWDYSEERVAPDLVADLKALAARLDQGAAIRAALGELLHESEVEALRRRIDECIRRPLYPRPGMRRAVPWPPV
jgi:hypothetical protein